jgi:hypothetical protein
MNIELSKDEITNLLFALNSLKVSGRESMVTILRLMQKLEEAAQPPLPDFASAED